MDDLPILIIDFNDCWQSSSGSGWLYYEPLKVIVGQRFLAVDCFDDTLTSAVSVVSRSTYVAFLLPTVPAESSESSL